MNKWLMYFCITLCCFCGTITITIAQINSYGISTGIGKGTILKQSLDGDASYDILTGYTLGVIYNRKMNDIIHLHTSINWYNNSVVITPAFYPGINLAPKSYALQMIYIPLYLRMNLSKYFFITGGFTGDIDVTKHNQITDQSGLGASIGAGFEMAVSNSFSIQLNPYMNFHGLILSHKDKYPERLLDTGIKLNLVINK
ncbi:MAG TPA: outer membrane beta-barrel protein [Saprospiraceae bacterium]|nr:outer membrane beta-barrel protein [Saprospiraceae bacterium]HRO08192.1 outer membrane beta-barrel protein [Saprospiraceae bacterium]HRO74378.1 outer membrane beta-barrel protein [Saprospiraceae bacterium]HRP41585.1 outer membrane beta-barrel protein [Saprospiraceae bacterium]